MGVAAMQTERKHREFWKAEPGAGGAKLVVGLLCLAIRPSFPPSSGEERINFAAFFQIAVELQLPLFSVTHLIHSLLVWWKYFAFKLPLRDTYRTVRSRDRVYVLANNLKAWRQLCKKNQNTGNGGQVPKIGSDPEFLGSKDVEIELVNIAPSFCDTGDPPPINREGWRSAEDCTGVGHPGNREDSPA